MKIILIIALFLTINCVAQTPDFQWATRAGGYSWDLGRSVAADRSGNIYLIGYFDSPTITFGEITLTNKNDNSYSADIFLVKYNAEGNVLWAKSFGGYSNDYAMSVSSDPLGNLIIAGVFSSPSLTFGTVTLVNDSADDAFVVKFDDSGNVLWAKNVGEQLSAASTSVVTDAFCNVFLTGSFFYNIKFGDITLTSSGIGMFFVKFDPEGNVLWANKADGVDAEGFMGATDSDGNYFISGDFYGDTLAFHEIKLINTGERDIFVAKLNASGDFLWAKKAGGVSFDWGHGVATDTLGNVVITGWVYGQQHVYFDTINFEVVNGCIYTAKYDPSGNILWVKTTTGNGLDMGSSIAIDSTGNIFTSGLLSSEYLYIDDNLFVIPQMSNSIITIKYDASGTFQWAKIVEGGNCGIDILSTSTIAGDVLIAGYFHSQTLTFGNTTLINANNSTSTSDVFLAKMDNLTGIEKFSSSNSAFEIYPNPGKGQINIASTKLIDEIRITNILGQLVYRATVNDNNFSFYLDTPGIYLITISVENQKITKKLVVTQ
jgi:hypothetical protein